MSQIKWVAEAFVIAVALNYSALVLSQQSVSENASWNHTFHGNVKYTLQATHFPEESLYRPLLGASVDDHFASSRLKWQFHKSAWDAQVDYQIVGYYRDRLGLQPSTEQYLQRALYPDDQFRWFDLTKVFHDEEKSVALHRLDRFNIGYARDDWVVRLGRQIVSWGNGLLFNSVDFFNPFDPASLDKEYKIGDDMLFGQYLANDGDDVQVVAVIRRNGAGDVREAVASEAIKYHAWVDNWLNGESWFSGAELEVVIARHYRDEIIAAGLVNNVGDAVWRGELMLSHSTGYANSSASGSSALRSSESDKLVMSFVTNLSYSWVWLGKNVSGIVEYYYNGFGLTGDYSLERVMSDAALFERVERGELYTIGRHYLGLSGVVELTPLMTFSPSAFVNLADQSALVQLSVSYSAAQNVQIIGAINLPVGSSGTEYGGLKQTTGSVNDVPLSSDLGFFFQAAYYF
ncbi:hypothetical protein NBRC116494_10200 [Aurantivibrio plasticivorans]